MKIKTRSNRASSTILMVFAILFFVFNSCKKEVVGTTREELAIQKFLIDRDIDAEPTSTGLYYIEEVAGTGEYPVLSDTVEVYYKGMYLDGRIFDSHLTGEPFTFPIGEGQVITGWEEGLSYMKPGGEAMLIIPSILAYGISGYGQIPGGTPLVFEVKLLNIVPGPNH
jgi:FKBP-type peptidyl-prolyl cis-trans isomerase